MKVNGKKLFVILLSFLLFSDLPLVSTNRTGRQLSRIKQATKKPTRMNKSQAIKQQASEPIAIATTPSLIKDELSNPVEKTSKDKQASEVVIQPISEKEFNQEIEALESTEPAKAEESFFDNAIKTSSQWAIWAFDVTTNFAQQAWTWTTDVGFVKLKEFKNWLFNKTSCSESCSCHSHS